jgi:hypothetical protein
MGNLIGRPQLERQFPTITQLIKKTEHTLKEGTWPGTGPGPGPGAGPCAGPCMVLEEKKIYFNFLAEAYAT